jgi:hypothetical protein
VHLGKHARPGSGDQFEDVVAVADILAGAKFALATYPSETEWLLSQAIRVIAENKI